MKNMTIVKKASRAATMLAMSATMLTAVACLHAHEDEDHHYDVHFKNRWNKAIAVWSGHDKYWNVNPHPVYVPYEMLDNYESMGEKISAGKSNSYVMKEGRYYEDMFGDGDSLYVAVFDANPANEGDSLHFLASYLLSLEDLRRLHFRLSYPPMEDMKGVHMWPSYEEIVRQARQD